MARWLPNLLTFLHATKDRNERCPEAEYLVRLEKKCRAKISQLLCLVQIHIRKYVFFSKSQIFDFGGTFSWSKNSPCGTNNTSTKEVEDSVGETF